MRVVPDCGGVERKHFAMFIRHRDSRHRTERAEWASLPSLGLFPAPSHHQEFRRENSLSFMPVHLAVSSMEYAFRHFEIYPSAHMITGDGCLWSWSPTTRGFLANRSARWPASGWMQDRGMSADEAVMCSSLSSIVLLPQICCKV